jgi:hypothetical protein
VSEMIRFSPHAEAVLAEKVETFNQKAPNDRLADLDTVRAVYRRGAREFMPARLVQTRHSAAMSRVDAYLHLLQSGQARNSAYISDFDLLPETHPLAAEERIDPATELTVTRPFYSDYKTVRDAVVAITEFSGLGYEAEDAFKAAWIRAVYEGTNPFNRAMTLAELQAESSDAELLPDYTVLTQKGIES